MSCISIHRVQGYDLLLLVAHHIVTGRLLATHLRCQSTATMGTDSFHNYIKKIIFIILNSSSTITKYVEIKILDIISMLLFGQYDEQ